MDLGIKERVAIVAAASKGLGRAVAEGLAREGATVAICARNQKVLEKTAQEIREKTGAEVLARPVDVTIYAQVQQFVATTLEQFGRVDICVTNAGGPPAKNFAETSVEDWQRGFDLNFLSTLYFAREVLPLMRKQRWGRLITITSISVKQPIDGLVLSNAIRAGVTGLVKSMANEYAKDNVLINNVCPGSFLTDRARELAANQAAREGVSPEVIVERNGRNVPLGRVGQPEEFANAVVFLASERASYITGVSLAVDGGYVKGLF